MDSRRIREQSLDVAVRLNFRINRERPVLDEPTANRSPDDTIDRLLCLHAAAAVAYGFDRAKALAWVKQGGLLKGLRHRNGSFWRGQMGRWIAFECR
jgi:hypothetical protein